MKILLAIDGSKFSEAATQTVAAQAWPQQTEVQILNVIEISPQLPEMMAYYPGIERSRDAQRKLAETAVAKSAGVLRSKPFQVTTRVELGNPKAKIIDAAEEWHADLIVIGSHGRTGLDRFLMGSLAEDVLRHAHCSVELVRIPSTGKRSKRSGASADAKVRRILLAIDDSRFSQAALRVLIEHVSSDETEIRVLNVIEPMPLLIVRGTGAYGEIFKQRRAARTKHARDLVAKIAQTLRAKSVKVSAAVVRGDAKSKIIDAAEEWQADLVVLGSHGQTGLERFSIGSVAGTVARHACCSVEIVRIPPTSRISD